MKDTSKTCRVLTVTCALLSGCAAMADVGYNNFANDLSYNFNTEGKLIGDQIILATGWNDNSIVTNFSLFYYAANAGANAKATVSFYKNDGDLVNGYRAPGSLIWSSGAFAIGDTSRSQITFDEDFGTGQAVPHSFTWTILFSDLASGGEAGVALFSPPTVGNNFKDFWGYEPSLSQWTLRTNSVANSDFAAQLLGVAVPEPGTIGIIGLGAAFLAFRFRSARK